MKYIGTFKDIDNKGYTVYIITNKSEQITKEITLGATPFVTEMDQSDDNIYKPVKYQSATVNVITQNESDYMFDVYSGTPNNTDIRLYDSQNNLVWGGFATPVLYNNGYTKPHESLSIECIDGLSILQYYKYSTNEKSIKSFSEIITNILSKCEVYDYFYVSTSVRLTSSTNRCILNDLVISEQNFFDEKESNETDDDVAWTCQEVLEEICQYLGLVCVAEGNAVYFLDLDAIKNNVNTYYKYTVGLIGHSPVTLSDPISIDGSLYRGSGSTISLDNVYNKVSVSDDFYTFDDVIPDLYDTAKNITASSDPTLQSSTNINEGMYGEVVQGSTGNQANDDNGNMILMIDRVWSPDDDYYTDFNAVFVKYFNNPYYKFYNYSGSNTSLNYTDTKSMHGAIIAKFYVKKMEETYRQSWFEYLAGINNYSEHTLDDWMAKNQISQVTFKDYILMCNPEQNHITNEQMTSYPFFETIGSDFNALYGGDNAYLIITGKYMFHDVSDDPYPIPEGEVDLAEGRYAMDAGHTYILAKLQWGGQYWNGSNWQNSSCTFKIPYMRDDTSDGDRRADGTMFKSLEFVNTVTWRLGLDKKGYMIPMPTGKVLTGAPKVTIYKPFDPNYHSSKSGDNEGQWYKHYVVLLEDFNVKAVIGDPTFSDANDTDTVYTNVINNHHVQEMDEIKCKICTNDGKKPNFSSVGYTVNSDYHFLNTIYNSALTSNGVINYKGQSNSGNLRPEEWIIYRLTNQYSEPKTRLNLSLNKRYKPYSLMTDKWLPGKKFIVDSQSTDFAMATTTITLVEKG